MAVANNLQNTVLFHRKQAALSRKDLAELAGVGKTVVYDIENGKQTVKWSSILPILSALNISISFNSPLIPKSRHRKYDVGTSP